METILLSIVFVGAAFGLIAIRILLVKDGEFKGTCSTNSPFLKASIGPCPVCGKEKDGQCSFESPIRAVDEA